MRVSKHAYTINEKECTLFVLGDSAASDAESLFVAHDENGKVKKFFESYSSANSQIIRFFKQVNFLVTKIRTSSSASF